MRVWEVAVEALLELVLAADGLGGCLCLFCGDLRNLGSRFCGCWWGCGDYELLFGGWYVGGAKEAELGICSGEDLGCFFWEVDFPFPGQDAEDT